MKATNCRVRFGRSLRSAIACQRKWLRIPDAYFREWKRRFRGETWCGPEAGGSRSLRLPKCLEPLASSPKNTLQHAYQLQYQFYHFYIHSSSCLLSFNYFLLSKKFSYRLSSKIKNNERKCQREWNLSSFTVASAILSLRSCVSHPGVHRWSLNEEVIFISPGLRSN